VLAAGAFIGRDHPTRGTAEVLVDDDDTRFLRSERFETDNGPNLRVCLVNSSTGDVSDYVSLGGLNDNIEGQAGQGVQFRMASYSPTDRGEGPISRRDDRRQPCKHRRTTRALLSGYSLRLIA